MTDLKRKAQEVADAGRFGDTHLIHVHTDELRGLAALMPDGKLTTNPVTGLPEAFFFLPFLAGLGAAAAPAAAATTAGLGAAAGTAGALGAGMTAGMGAAASGLAGLGAAAPAAAGLGATGAGTAAGLTAASAAAPALSATGAAAGGAGALAAPTAAASALPTATGAAGAGAGAGASGIASLGGAGQAGAALAGPASFANPAGATAAGLAGAFPAAPGAVTTGSGGASGLGGLFGGSMDAGKMLQYGALASMMMPQGGGGGGGEKKGKKLSGQNYDRGEQAVAPNEGGDGGVTSEFNYFPRARYYAGGGLVKGYAEGGLASLAPQQGGGDEELIDATVAALQGQVPNPDAIIQQFIQVFGPNALQDLIAKVQGGGDGMSDSVPATVSGAGGQEPAALSEGEFVVPADVVSGLGNGSTEAGARQLEGMMDRTRMMRGGGMVQPPAINARNAMPM